MKTVLVFMILLSGLAAWEEIQQLIQRYSWKREDYRIPIWITDWKTWKKNLDSHHFSYGLFVLVMFISIHFIRLELWQAPIYWLSFFYLRNIWMHIIFKKKPIYKYLYTFWK